MEYAQLNERGTEAVQINTHGNIEWDENNYCSAAALVKDGKAEQFRVVELHETDPPDINPETQVAFRDGCEFVNGGWQYKWVVREKYSAEMIGTLKSEKISLIKNYRDKLSKDGGYKVRSNWFHSDTFSRSQQLGLALMQENIPKGLMWKTMQGTFIEMTPVLAQNILNAAAIQDANIFSYAETLINQVKELGTVEEVVSFDITRNWPETYTQGE